MSGRIAERVILTLWLALVWILLWGSVSAPVLVSGVVVAPLCLALCRLPARSMIARPRVWWLPRSSARFARDLLTSSVQVAWTSMRRGPATTSAIVALHVHCPSDTTLTLVANRLSLEPGTLVVDIDRATDTMYLYLLDVRSEQDIDKARASARLRIDAVLRALGEERS